MEKGAVVIALLVIASVASGCLGPSDTPPSDGGDDAGPEPLRILVSDDRPRVKDRVEFVLDGDPPEGSVGWDFGDGTSASGRNASHVYVAPGQYVATVTLFAEDNTLHGNRTITVRAPNGSDDNDTGDADDDPALPTGTPLAWGEPSAKSLRPGINMVTGGAGCTTSFIFTEYWERYFIATAAHCVASGSSTDTDGCEAPVNDLGIESTLYLDDGDDSTFSGGAGTTTATVVYSSWNTMQDVGETDDAACAGNDFALLEIDSADWDKIHPASLHFRAPTGLADAATDDIWGFGASGIKQGLEPASPKQGLYVTTLNGGWTHNVYLFTPGIPGDSGGHIMTDDGQALGVASTIRADGSNNYADIGRTIDYMALHTGLDVQLVTWDDFNPSLA